MGFFKNLLSGAASALGFSKSGAGGIGGLINKAKNFIGSGLSALNSKTGKNIVGAISQFAPSVGEAVGSLKKYGNMANNFLGGGAERKGERFIKQSPILSQVDRWDRPSRSERRPTIEKVRPRREPDEDAGEESMGLSSMFA